MVNSRGLLPWTHHHIARVRPQLWSCLKGVYMWLLDTKAGIPWDSVRSSFKYNQARWIPLKTALSGPVSSDSGVETPMTSLAYLLCATCRRLVVTLRSRLYLVRWTALPLCLAFLYILSHLFIRCFTEVLTQGRWRFPFLTFCVVWSCQWFPRSLWWMLDQFSSTVLLSGWVDK